MGKIFRKLSFYLFLLICSATGYAQVSTLPNGVARDTSMGNNNNDKWKSEDPKISYEHLNSVRTYYPDTAINKFHRAPFTQTWGRDLGNLGGPVNNLFFTPEDRVGPTLGYHVYDVYRYNVDSLNFYNTRRPYSNFNYLLGSRAEQKASLMHTQNVMPNWNFAAEYRKTNSRGFYNSQRSNNDNAFLSTNYKSNNKRYVLYAGMVYNKLQTDENGGIVNQIDFDSSKYSDRRTIKTAYQESTYSQTVARSPVTNSLRDFTFLLQHSYQWGKTDTTYNADSTQYATRLLPRFSVTHRLAASTEQHTYKDLAPDSLRYVSLFEQQFTNNGSYVSGGDSVLARQKWNWIDNKFLLNGFLGKEGKQVGFSAGFGIRYDQFISQPDTVGRDKNDIVSNYLEGELKKEALQPGAWGYGANTKFFITGAQAGSFLLNAQIGKQLKNNIGGFAAGFEQRLNSAPYSYTTYTNAYTRITNNFGKESVTTLFAMLESPRLRLSAGYRNHVVANYIYINEQGRPDQYAGTYSISQVWGRKVFKLGNFYFDNEVVFQQVPDNAPVNVPALMGRHRFSYERPMFKRSLILAAGIDVRYNTQYDPAGYNAMLNRFFYQNSKSVGNTPEMAIFLNFRIKRFRAFLMGDNLQQLFSKNAILYTGTPVLNYNNTGTSILPIYAAPDALFRFGFNWVMVN